MQQKLAAMGSLSAYLAKAIQIPAVIQEIGRLREITFRAAGEGTQKAVDLDRFDDHYLHLFIWDSKNQCVVGAYRLGLVEHRSTNGQNGDLYSQTLFKFSSRLQHAITPGIELGRSFIRPEYQRNTLSLSLLWKGIGAFIARNPHIRCLFGPVSISAAYSPSSQNLLVDFLASIFQHDPLQGTIYAYTPFEGSCNRLWQRDELAEITTLEGILELVKLLEPDGKTMPVLLRHYLKMGGRVLSFHVDKNFGNCVDAFVVTDLKTCNPRLLKRYMGAREASDYLRFHAGNTPDQPAQNPLGNAAMDQSM